MRKTHDLLPLTPGLAIVVVLIALAPGLVSWWDGRTLRRQLDDPALPERLHAARVRRGATFGAAAVLLAVVSIEAAVWSLPLTIAFAMAAAYPLRRALYGETWSLFTYGWFFIRLSVSVWLFWILLAAVPWIASSAGTWDWLVASILGALLLIFNARYAEILRIILKTREIADPTLRSRFETLVAKSGLPAPRFERVPLEGGVIANALALPSLRRSSVLFSDTLLERLETDETVAICAHELAHLEHFNRAFLRRIDIENIALIASAVLVAPVARLVGLTSVLLVQAVWTFGFAAVIVRRAKDRQKNETASDLRAVQLCGDPEALVRGLTRLYTMARLPRRFDQQQERQATHPSLSRRIRDIRAAAGIAAGPVGVAATFTGADGRTSVTFDQDSLSWSEGEAATHTLKYAYLAELRIHARVSRAPALVAVERGGRRWEMTLAQDDLARAQSVLDTVDGRLTEPGPQPSVWPKLRRPVIAMGAMIGLASGQFALALVALLAIMQPSAPLLGATGIASMAAGAVLFRHSDMFGGAFTELALILAALGIVLLFVARAKREESVSRAARAAVAGLGVLAALATMMFVLGGTDPIRLHQSGQSVTSAPVLLLAFAGALTIWRSKAAKYAAIPVIVLAGATTGVASTSFLDRFGDDIFISPSPSLQWTEANGSVIREFSVPFTGDSLQLSPRGQLVALVAPEYDHYDDEARVKTRFHIGRGGPRLTAVTADDLLFVDEERVLIVRSTGDGAELAEADAEQPERATWRLQIPDITHPQLSVHSATGRWRVVGRSQNQGVVAVSGILGTAQVRRQEWPSPPEDGGWIKSVAASDNDLLVVEAHYRPGLLQRCGLWQLAWLVQPDPETRFRFASPAQDRGLMTSRLEATCFPAGLDREGLICGAFDGTRTRFVSVDPGSRQVSPLGWMAGRYVFTRRPNNGWLSGWSTSTPVAINLDRRIVVQGERARDYRAFAVTGADDVVATMTFNGQGSTIRLIRLSNVESSSARAVE